MTNYSGMNKANLLSSEKRLSIVIDFFVFLSQRGTSDRESEPAKVPMEAINDEDNRFEIPTDQSIQSKNANEVIYSDGVVPSNNANNSELFTTQSNDLDTRLK